MSIADIPPTRTGTISAAAFDAAASTGERDAAQVYGNCAPELIPMLQSLLLAYDESRTRLKPEHKRLRKQIESLRQGYDGTKAQCYKCGKLHDNDDLEIHHINENPSDNRLINTPPISGKCNRELNGAKGGEINRQRAAAFRSTFSNVTLLSEREQARTVAIDDEEERASPGRREMQRHDQMRPLWDKWLADKENGAFSRFPNGLTVSALAKLAVNALMRKDGTKGSSITYRRYAEEDILGGILEVWLDDDGKRNVRYLGRPNPYVYKEVQA